MTYDLVLEDVSKHFGLVTAVKDFNLQVKEKELVSLLGPSGCGKTTTLRIIAGFEKPDQGKVYIRDQEVSRLPAERRDVGMVFQNYALFPHMTVQQNIAFPMKLAKLSKKQIQKQVQEYLTLVKLEGFGNRYPQQLSGGQRQRVALVRALAKNPKILLLDEPLSALDAKIREELRGEIRKLQQKVEITAVYVTHDQEEALSISDRVVVMHQGHIEQVGTPMEIYNTPHSLFVASFVGSMNFFEGEVVFNDHYLLRWKNHSLKINLADPAPSDKVILAVRPELMTIARSESEIPEGFNVIRGRITLMVFLGSIIRLELSTGEATLKIDLPAEKSIGLSLGDEVFACFPPQVGVIITNIPTNQRKTNEKRTSG